MNDQIASVIAALTDVRNQLSEMTAQVDDALKWAQEIRNG